MRHVNVVTTCMAMCFWLLLPALTLGADDLEVTMEIIDDVSQLSGLVSEMPGPGEADSPSVVDGRDDDADTPGSDSGYTADGFEHNDMDDDAHERALQSEDDFEEGEDVDLDLMADESEPML